MTRPAPTHRETLRYSLWSQLLEASRLGVPKQDLIWAAQRVLDEVAGHIAEDQPRNPYNHLS